MAESWDDAQWPSKLKAKKKKKNPFLATRNSSVALAQKSVSIDSHARSTLVVWPYAVPCIQRFPLGRVFTSRVPAYK